MTCSSGPTALPSHQDTVLPAPETYKTAKSTSTLSLGPNGETDDRLEPMCLEDQAVGQVPKLVNLASDGPHLALPVSLTLMGSHPPSL